MLAHPRDVTNYVLPLVKVGLLGLEVYYAGYDEVTRRDLLRLAKQHGLIVTGGSDFHGLNRMARASGLGEAQVPPEVVDRLKEKACG